MANQKNTTADIMANRVNGVIKSFESFKTSLRNNKEKVSEEQFTKMIDYLQKSIDTNMTEIQEIFATDNSFKL